MDDASVGATSGSFGSTLPTFCCVVIRQPALFFSWFVPPWSKTTISHSSFFGTPQIGGRCNSTNRDSGILATSGAAEPDGEDADVDAADPEGVTGEELERSGVELALRDGVGAGTSWEQAASRLADATSAAAAAAADRRRWNARDIARMPTTLEPRGPGHAGRAPGLPSHGRVLACNYLEDSPICEYMIYRLEGIGFTVFDISGSPRRSQ